MGNCATFTNDLYADLRACNPDSERQSVNRKPDPYPSHAANQEFNIRRSFSLEDSELREPMTEDPYRKYITQNTNEKQIPDQIEEKVLEFKMLSVRESMDSKASESFMKNKTKAEMTMNETNKEPPAQYSTRIRSPNMTVDMGVEPMPPMSRDKIARSYMSPRIRSPMKSPKDKNVLDNSSLFVSPFKKDDVPITSYQKFKQQKTPNPLNSHFFTQTLDLLGPFEYTVSEDYFRQNPSFQSFLQSTMNLPISAPVRLENNAVYTGQWLNGQRNGRGKQVWSDGSVYEGYWYNNQAHCKGRLIHSQGTVYDGYWSLDQAHGSGSYFTIEGSCYKGGWYEDKQHGFGVEKWASGAIYEGDYFMGMKHGKGLFRWEDGASYCGEFAENLIQGKGKYKWSDGREYDGDWIGNKMDGKGVFKWPDGRIYSGNYEDDEKNGIGVFFWPDGSLYKGCWKGGMQNGKGKFIDKDGKVKEGVWRNGVFEGD